MQDVTQLNWVKKSKTCIKGGKDVRIKLVDYTTTRKAIQFTFYDGSYKIFSDDSEYIEFAILKNRMFFRKSNITDGYKLTVSSKEKDTTETRYVKCTNDKFLSQATVFEGCYDIKYDNFYELYYIENGELNKDECRN